MSLRLAPGKAWTDVISRAASVAPEAFAVDRLRNLFSNSWQDAGLPSLVTTPVDGSTLTQLSRISSSVARSASNGALVASLACDDEDLAAKLAKDLQAFKVGINRPRSRGDREEPFGGRGASGARRS